MLELVGVMALDAVSECDEYDVLACIRKLILDSMIDLLAEDMYLSKITSDFANEVCIEVEGERVRDLRAAEEVVLVVSGWAEGSPRLYFGQAGQLQTHSRGRATRRVKTNNPYEMKRNNVNGFMR
jgi:hypothetical protein